MQAAFGRSPLGRVNVSLASTLLTIVGFFVASHRSAAQTPVLTWHYDNSRSGMNTTEVVLSPNNVNYKTFGKLSTKPVDGYVVAQPLYVPNVTVAGHGVHNLVFVVTMHDSVYAFDADDTKGAPLWHTSILAHSPVGATTVPATLKHDAGTTGWTELGIISTPVIDGAAGILYLVAETYENSRVVHRLHALDITSGTETLGGPATIAAMFTQNGATTIFKDLYEMNRPGLLLTNGSVFIAWGSNGNNYYSQGWVMSYSASTLQNLGAATLEPGKQLASIWQKGAGIAADSTGNIYAVNGEGPYTAATNLSMSAVKFNQTNGVTLVDYFTPYNHKTLGATDKDLTGLVLLPTQSGTFPREMIAMGKEGTIYLLNRDKLGHLCGACTTRDTQIVQEIPQGAGTGGGNPCYWNQKLYFTGDRLPIQAYKVQNGKLLLPPAKSPQSMPGGGHCFVTSNGASNGILWFMNGATLYALDAVTLKTLYNASQAPNHRDTLPPLPHFPEPIATNGKVYIGTQNSLVTYGLLP
jgi:hypothetical protein